MGYCGFVVTNSSEQPSWAIELHCHEASTSLSYVAPSEKRRVLLPITPSKRGWLRSEACYLQSLFPLSTVRFIVPIAEPCRALILPEPKGEPLRSLLLRQRAPFGEERDFDGLAAYDGAQSISRIHWPSVAKGEPAVKRFEQEMPTETLIFDFMRAGENDEERLSQLCLWAVECEKIDRDFTIRMPQRLLASEKEGIDAILEYLALY